MKSFSRILIFAALLVFATASLFSQTVYFVSTGGSDSNDGLSWATAFESVQKGINEANVGGGGEVWVAQGTYYPTEYLTDALGQRNSSHGDFYKSFSMYAGVNVYGGFFGNEASKEARAKNSGDAWDFTYPTILDGQDVSYHVVWFGTNGFHTETYEGIDISVPSDLAAQSIIDGFTIRNGFANYPLRVENQTAPRRDFCHYSGGGVLATGKAEVHNCIVEDNRAKYSGAGIAMQYGSKTIGSLVQNNEGIGANFYYAGIFGFGAFNYWRHDGAGIAARGDANRKPLIDNCVIHNNLGKANDNYPNAPTSTSNKFNQGGGIFLYYGDMTNTTISSNNIVNNPSPYSGGSSASCGGGVYLARFTMVDNSVITDNGFLTGSQNGAGMFIGDYSDLAGNYNDIVVKNSYFHSNRAGGALAIDSRYSHIENSIFANNSGVGVYGYGNCKNSRVVNCLMYNNSGVGWGNSTNSNNTGNSLINSTVVRNGTGISNGNTSGTYSVRNSVVWGNNSNPSTPNVQFDYSAFSYTPPAGTNNIQLDTNNDLGPKFVNPTASHGINQVGWQDASWRVQDGSPLIDAGFNDYVLPITNVDLDGNNRNQGAGVDIGAYEFTLYQLALSVNPVGGGAAIILNNSSTSGMFAEGTPMTIRATANSGYSFWKWTLDGITMSKNSELGFNMPAENLSLVAHFSDNPDAPTNGLPAGNNVPVATTQMSWTAPVSGVTPTGYKVYLYSEADGYTDPIIDGLGVSTTYYNGLYLAMNTTYLARVHSIFDPDYKGTSAPLEWYFKTENIVLYDVVLSNNPAEGGVVLIQNNGSTSGQFEAGTVLNITSTINTGYNFWKWTLDGTTVSTVPNFEYTVPAVNVNLVANYYQNPDAPTNGTPTGNDVPFTTSVIGWDAPASGNTPTSYFFNLFSDEDMYSTPIIDNAEVTATEYTGLTLSGGTTYKVMVYSHFDPDAKGTSSALTWFFTTEEGGLPGTPSGVTVTSLENGDLRLDWTASEWATSYKVYSSEEPYAEFAQWNLEETVSGVTTWTDSDPAAAKKFYRITGNR